MLNASTAVATTLAEESLPGILKKRFAGLDAKPRLRVLSKSLASLALLDAFDDYSGTLESINLDGRPRSLGLNKRSQLT
ncbi:hypothetical protein [Herbaspirillum camelliae]|uniref:hypothetical protein n=1 Tax=Herbaspirillum camelliae TaxID=1892903 RepID=UPI000949DAE5|nr:hypothetical protein [Herbaspirillum camelliae]